MRFSVPHYASIWDVHQIASKILCNVCCALHLLIGCHYYMSIVHPPLITLFGLSAPCSWPCLRSRHNLPPFFNTPSFSDMPLYVNLGWSCIIQMMIACHHPAGNDVSGAETLCADLWCTCTKLIAWHVPSPSFLDSYSAADFMSFSLIEAVVLRNPKSKMGKINFFFPFFPFLLNSPLLLGNQLMHRFKCS